MTLGTLHQAFENYANESVKCRLKSISLRDAQSIKHGFVYLYQGSDYEYLTSNKASIKGVYGPNGSGKTTLIKALIVLKKLLSGESIEEEIKGFTTIKEKGTILGASFEIITAGVGFGVDYYVGFGKNLETNQFSIGFEELYVSAKVLKDYQYDGVLHTPICSNMRHQCVISTIHRKRNRAFGPLKKYKELMGPMYPEANKKLCKWLFTTAVSSCSFIFSDHAWNSIYYNDPSPRRFYENDEDIIDWWEDMTHEEQEEVENANSYAMNNKSLLAYFIARTVPSVFAQKHLYIFDNKYFGSILSEKKLPLSFYLDDDERIWLETHRDNDGALLSYSYYNEFERNPSDFHESVKSYTRKEWNNVWHLVETGTFTIILNGIDFLNETQCHVIKKTIDSINNVLPFIIPGMIIRMEELNLSEDDLNWEKQMHITEDDFFRFDYIFRLSAINNTKERLEEYRKELDSGKKPVGYFSVRNGISIPLANEADGVLRIISMISWLIRAFNDTSSCVIIDELDSGIFEYLLGEILSAFKDYGKGQLLFTAHNLRPLEVLPSNCISFTTSNPEHRFETIYGVPKGMTLREAYYRTIVLGGQENNLYTSTDKFSIAKAFLRACDSEGESK